MKRIGGKRNIGMGRRRVIAIEEEAVSVRDEGSVRKMRMRL